MPARRNPAWIVVAGSLGLLAALVGLLAWLTSPGRGGNAAPLLVHCAASARAPLEAVAQDYERDHGQPIQMQFGASQDLLSGIKASRQGDLYLPADDSYITEARHDGLIAEELPLGQQRAVILVRAAYPGPLASWADLTAPGVKLAQANDAAAIGKLTHDRLPPDRWKALEARTVARLGTVTDVANAVKLGTVDAGVVWDSVAGLYPDLRTMKLPELAPVTARLEIAVLRCSERSSDALRFARYAAARDKGLPQFRKFGFTVVGDE
jgi:ABC-type molybdate transport system substrate-binding protein